VSRPRFLADENLNERLVLSLERRVRGLAFLRIRDVGLSGCSDEEILEWADDEGCLLVTHDARTMPRHAYDRVDAGIPVAGVLIIPDDAPTRAVIEDLALIAEASTMEDWRDRVVFLPLAG
jgi:predicted nuclease of predicted toxin-antitoxin system